MVICNRRFIGYSLFIITAILPVSCFKSLTVTNVVYQNNFDSYNLNTVEVYGWGPSLFELVPDVRIGSYNSNAVLGKLNNNIVKLSLNDLPTHQVLRVEFDLYIHNKWKNDLWQLAFNGSQQLITGFSNDTTIKQSYPNWLNTSLSAAGADAQNTNLPGVCSLVSSIRGTSLYRIVKTIEHSANSFVFTCGDSGGTFNDTCTRSWSIDNLKVSVFKN